MIFYSHVNEDNDLEKRLMDSGTFQDLVCIAGSGERVIALMAHPFLKRLSAIDNNKEVLFLLELKLKALRYLNIQDYLKFVGFSEANSRLQLFEKFNKQLSPSCQEYWNNRSKAIRKGILFYGHFEKFLNRFRPLFKAFLGKSFYKSFDIPFHKNSHFPHWKWGLLKKIFSQRWVFFLGGNKDTAFIAPDAKRSYIPFGLQEVLETDLVKKSFMFHLIFKGHLKDMNPEFLPPSLKFEHLKRIKNALEKEQIEISYHHQDLKTFLQSFSNEQNENTFYSFSDILSFCDLEYLKTSILNLSLKAGKEQWGVFRAFIRKRLSNSEFIALHKNLIELEDISYLEKTRMYQVFKFKI